MDDAKEVIEAAKLEQRKERIRAAARTAEERRRLPKPQHDMNQSNRYEVAPQAVVDQTLSAKHWAEKAKQQAMTASIIAARDAMDNGWMGDAEFDKRMQLASYMAFTSMKTPDKQRQQIRENVANAISTNIKTPWEGHKWAAAFQIKTLMKDMEKVMKLEPAQWETETYAYPGNFAGKHIVLQMVVQDDVTPLEVYHLMQLRHGDVHGNVVAFIMDHNLIRHFVDTTPRDEEDDVTDGFEELMNKLNDDATR